MKDTFNSKGASAGVNAKALNASAIVGEQWLTDTPSAMLGFAMRNKLKTEATPYPVLIPGLGTNFGDMLRSFDQVGADQGAPRWWNDMTSPGICVLKMEPLIAPTRNGSKTLVNIIFERLWSKSRLFNNDVDNMQPTDLAAISIGTAFLKAYIALGFKIMSIIKVREDDINLYKYASDMLAALGFQHTPRDIREHRMAWTDIFNDDIIGAINDAKWIDATYPGANHWAAVLSKWYKDCDTETDYCQTYTFTLQSFWMLTYQVAGQNTHYWNFTKQPMPTSIWDFFDLIQSFIRALFFDSSARMVQAVLESIYKRTNGDNSLDIGPVDLSELSYSFDDEIVSFEYNRDILLAIHNATILQGVHVGDALQNPETGTWAQAITVDANSPGDVASRFTKLINLPWPDASKCDLINATMWTVVRHKEAAWADLAFDADICGSEIISDATMFRYVPSASDNRGYALTYIPLQSVLFSGGTINSQPAYTQALMDTLSFTTQFNLAPITYIIADRDSEAHNPGYVHNVIAQLEAIFRCDHATLAAMKEQYLRNFWGYPFTVAGEVGTFSTAGSEFKGSVNVPRDGGPSYSTPRGTRGSRGKKKNLKSKIASVEDDSKSEFNE